MDALKKNLNTAAVVLIAAGLIGWIVWPQNKALILAFLALGLIALAAYIVLNRAALAQKFQRKSLLYSGNLVLVVVLVLAILGLANYFLAKHNYRVDFTAAKLHSLSDQTVTVLKALKTDIVFKGFFRDGNYGRAAMENLLKIYAYHSARVSYEFLDPDKNPGLVQRYGITQDGTTIIEAGDKESRVTTTTEEDVTNALIKATRAQKKAICFLEGHGEESVDESGDNGYATAKTELEKLGYEVKKQSLALADRFPKDCALLIVPGPKKDLLPNEYETIRTYIKDGGRVLFLVDPETSTLLPLFLADYGFKLDNDIVVDTVSRLLGGDYFMPVVSEYEPHAITSKFSYATFYPYARSVEISDTKPEGATLTELAKTSPNSWSERELDQKEVKFDAAKDRQGPIGLAAVASFKTKTVAGAPAQAPTKPGEPAPAETAAKAEDSEKEARLAVIGDSDFAKNRYYGLSGNGNFFLNVVNWLTEESDLIAIQPKTQTPRTIQLTPSQGRLMFLVSVVILPLAVLLLGISVWARRKSL
ncbi:MAG: GldG family protein [Candidatus Aminicenantales bacterium]